VSTFLPKFIGEYRLKKKGRPTDVLNGNRFGNFITNKQSQYFNIFLIETSKIFNKFGTFLVKNENLFVFVTFRTSVSTFVVRINCT